MITAALLALAGPALFTKPAGVDTGHPSGAQTAPRIRIVPQAADAAIIDIEESADGTRLLTHNRLHAPKLWDAQRQILLVVLEGHRDAVWQVNFSPDGTKLLSLSFDKLQVWDSARAKLITQFTAPEGEKLMEAAFSPASDKIAIGSSNGRVRLLDAGNAVNIKALAQHGKAVSGVKFSPDSRLLLSHAQDGTAVAWDLNAGKARWQMNQLIRWPEFSKDGTWLLGAVPGDKALLINSENGQIVQTYPHKVGGRGVVFMTGEVGDRDFSGNVQMGPVFVGEKGDQPLTAEAKGDMVAYEPGSMKEAFRLKGHTDSLRELRISNDRRYIGTYGNDEKLKVWYVPERREIPFDLEDGSPMAGKFSPREDVFWLAYNEGEIHRYDLKAGKAVKSTYGAVMHLENGVVGGEGPTIFLGSGTRYTDTTRYNAYNLFYDVSGNRPASKMYLNFDTYKLSPSGDYMAFTSRENEYPSGGLSLWENRYRFYFDQRYDNIAWSPDGTTWAALLDDGLVEYVEVTTGKIIKKWTYEIDKDKSELSALTFHPNSKWVVSANHKNYAVLIWDIAEGKIIKELERWEDYPDQFTFSEDGKLLIGSSMRAMRLYDVESGKVIWELTDKEENELPNAYHLSPSGERLIIDLDNGWQVVDTRTRRVLLEIKDQPFYHARALAINGDGSRILTTSGKMAQLWDIDQKKLLAEMPHQDAPFYGKFETQDSRIVTIDKMGGASIWDANVKTQAPKKLASLVFMRDGSWLAYDDQGRYDASDPNNVTGAYFVMEWEHGLEAITMPQLKGQFYEPQLIAKALGKAREPLRDVPSLESLRLYPSLTVKSADRPLVYDIQADERDQGGIGRLTFYLNGKQFYSKKSSPYVQLDLATYSAFLLPETHLPQDRGNLLTVTVSNETGDLVSPPVTIDVGVPKDLKAPEVTLHALFVGVGDYPGTNGDLQAPPSDATSLDQAIRATGEKLLPGRVKTTVLTTRGTNAELRPTRARILKWFEDTARVASSSDIIMVFFAGHGVSRIGEQTGYYFLTSEANPSEITPSIVNTATISGDDLRDSLSLIPANKQVVILDTCHSGAAGDSLLASERSVSGEYQRAWEAIRDTTGTWLLAGSASDQLSYESNNVDHGMLTYSLLEAIDRASPQGLRQTPSGELFVDVERWLNYAAERVESLKREVGVKGVQKPEFRRATRGATFDIGVLGQDQKGILNLKAPKPIVIVGTFEMDQEDPAGLENLIHQSLKDTTKIKPWFDVAKHPNVYRVAGSYVLEGESIKLRLFIQQFDEKQVRKTIETVELEGTKTQVADLVAKARSEIESRIAALESKGG